MAEMQIIPREVSMRILKRMVAFCIFTFLPLSTLAMMQGIDEASAVLPRTHPVSSMGDLQLLAEVAALKQCVSLTIENNAQNQEPLVTKKRKKNRWAKRRKIFSQEENVLLQDLGPDFKSFIEETRNKEDKKYKTFRHLHGDELNAENRKKWSRKRGNNRRDKYRILLRIWRQYRKNLGRSEGVSINPDMFLLVSQELEADPASERCFLRYGETESITKRNARQRIRDQLIEKYVDRYTYYVSDRESVPVDP